MAVKTYTKTIAYTRILLLQLNITTALKNALGNSYMDTEFTEQVNKAIDNQWIKAFTLYAEKKWRNRV